MENDCSSNGHRANWGGKEDGDPDDLATSSKRWRKWNLVWMTYTKVHDLPCMDPLIEKKITR